MSAFISEAYSMDEHIFTSNHTIIGTEAAHLMIDWLKKHGVNTMDVPAINVIVRDVERRQVRVRLYECNEEGKHFRRHGSVAKKRAVIQLESPPLPFPQGLWPLRPEVER